MCIPICNLSVISGIVPNLAHQSAEERARDAPRLPFLMKLNLLVEARGITSFEDLLQAKTEVEKELEVGKQKDLAEDKENDVESEERLPEEPKAKKAKKSPKVLIHFQPHFYIQHLFRSRASQT